MQYQFISWKFDKKKEDEDDDITFGTNPFFKLLALILVDMKLNHMSWKETVHFFDRSSQWNAIVEEKYPHIEEADDLWSEIKDEVGEEHAKFVIPILNRVSDQKAAMEANLQEALKKET